MITRADIVERVQEWGLAEQVVEKDYGPLGDRFRSGPR